MIRLIKASPNGLCRLDLKRSFAVDRSREHLFTDTALHGNGFPGDHLLIHARTSGDDDSVHRHSLTGADANSRTDGDQPRVDHSA